METKTEVTADELVEITNIFDNIPIKDLAENEAALKKIITYQRKVRENIRAAEATGKRPSKTTGQGKPKPVSLDATPAKA